MAPTTPTKPPVVFVHGLWLHAESWLNWIQCFREAGYEAKAVSWPGDAETTKATRKNPDAVANYGVTTIAEYIAQQIKTLDRKPVLIGHSFGGLLAQNLLGRDLGAAAIAIDPAPIKGVAELPLPALKSTFPVLRNPFNISRAVSLTEEQFRYGFTNAISEEESHQLYNAYAMPAPARPLFQAAFATLNPNAETRVNVENTTRGPLLLIAGTDDHTVPPVLVRSTLRKYRKSGAVTDFREYPDRGHSLILDHGWRDIADFCLTWLRDKGF
jgi:pimeloyl-ACP methyl ester carboxylesterase